MPSSTATGAHAEAMDVGRAVREAFPTLGRQVREEPLVYLDNAATTQKPECVLTALDEFYRTYNANVHRAVHTLSAEATQAYEHARQAVARFINAPSSDEVIFVRGTTEAINLVAQSYARPRLKPGDELLVTEMEHHSNIVPWQLVCEQTGATLKVASINENGELPFDAFTDQLSDRTAIVALSHVSNALGTVNPVREITCTAHAHGATVVVDGAQAVPHMPVDVQGLGCDFYAFSGHKMFGPTGIGVLYGRRDLLAVMPPYQGGGEMIESVSFEETTYREPPARFEAGTPNIAGAIGLAAACGYLTKLDFRAIETHEQRLLQYATRQLKRIPGLRLIGTAQDKGPVVSFVLDDIHAHDVATILDGCGVAVRAGHHCAEPVMRHFNVPATIRASFAFYNTTEDVDALIDALHRARELFGHE